MPKKRQYILPFLLLFALLIGGCKQPLDSEGNIEADHISYSVEYLDNMAGDIPTRLLPGEMDAFYTRDFVMTRIDGFFGQFSLIQVANLKKKTVTTMLNFFGNKVCYTGKRGEIPAGIKALDGAKIKILNEFNTVSDLESQKAIISLPAGSYEIYFTNEINIKSPNITTPYDFVDQVLTDFRVQLSVLKMRLILDSYNKQMIDPAQFDIPLEYEPVSREAMESIINSLFTKD